MTDSTQSQSNKLTVDLDSLDADKVDEILAQVYGDPVRSRLLEAAKAYFATTGGGTQERGHVDIHWDW
jgi:hypothetical protein